MKRRYRETALVLALMAACGVAGLRWPALQGATLRRGVVWEAEAEQGTIQAPMTVVWDEEASACNYVYAPGRDGAVSYRVTVPATGEYWLWARVCGVEAYLNSFYVSFDGGAETAYEIKQFDGAWGVWGWEAVHEKHEPVAPFYLSAGAHTLRFRPREAQTRLDRLLLTDDPSAVPTSITACGDRPIWTVGCLGDSITHGYPLATTDLTYPAQLQEGLAGVHGRHLFGVANWGLDGYRADRLLAALQSGGWLGSHPDFCLLMIGGVDLAQETLPDGSNLVQVLDETVGEVQAIVDLIRAHVNPDGSRPHVLVSTCTPTMDYWQCLGIAAYNERLRAELIGADLILTGNWDALYDPTFGRARSGLMTDALHPNAAGYGLIAENWLDATSRFVASMPLAKGWNLVSTPLHPASSTPAQAFQSIENACAIAYTYDAATQAPWRRYLPGVDSPVASDLQRVEAGRGIWMLATEPTRWVVRGWPASGDALSLFTGWNLVGYSGTSATPVAGALSSVAGQWDLVYAYDAERGAWLWCTAEALEAASLQEMAPGVGYWVRMRTDGHWQPD